MNELADIEIHDGLRELALFAGAGGVSSEGRSSDGGPSAPSRSTNTPAMYLSHGKTTERSRLSRFGTTCELLTDHRGEELLTSFLEASRVRTSALREPAKDSMAKGAVSGAKWRALSVKCDLATSSWRTHRCLFDGDSIESLQTLPKWGSMRNGELWELTTQVLHTDGNGSGYWPTPTIRGNNNAPKPGTKRGTGLATEVKMWPTPTATAYKGWSPNHNRADSDDRIDYTVERGAHMRSIPGRLNPEWVEWLMGWPIGHTGLEPLETDRCQEWWRWHGEY